MTDEKVKTVHLQIGKLLKSMREKSKQKGCKGEYGDDMRLSTLLNLLSKYGVKFEDFFYELDQTRNNSIEVDLLL